jgi:O-methyltransferase
MRSVLDRAMTRSGVASLLAQKMRRRGLTYLTGAKFVRIEGELDRIAAGGVAGDVVEFGVAAGGSAVVLARFARGDGRAFAGYDVFGTIPPPTSDKDDDKSRSRWATIAGGKARGLRGTTYYGYVENLFDRVSRTMADAGVAPDQRNVRLIKGLFAETWPVDPVGQIAFAHIDCDWYDPVRFCLAAIADRVTPGGAIVLDDYLDYGGCRTATDEFLSTRTDFDVLGGVNLILRRRAVRPG